MLKRYKSLYDGIAGAALNNNTFFHILALQFYFGFFELESFIIVDVMLILKLNNNNNCNKKKYWKKNKNNKEQ